MMENIPMTAEVQAFIKANSQRQKDEKIARFRRLNLYARKGQIVFAGSSLMEQFPIGEFLLDFQLPYVIYNRGIGGFTTAEFAAALEECVFALEPRYLFLNIGTNDMNEPGWKTEDLIARYAAILQTIRDRMPALRITLLAYYPVNPQVAPPIMQGVFANRTNPRIREANEAVRALAERFGAGFLDLNAGLVDADGNLKAEYTIEGMHMYATGYKPVLDALLPALARITAE